MTQAGSTLPLSDKQNTVARKPESQWVSAIKRLLRHKKGLFGLTIMTFLILVTLLAPLIVPYDPIELHLKDQLAPPSSTYLFGADELGRDILSRVIVGAIPSLKAGLLAVAVAAIVGILTGVPAGYLGGWVDMVIMRIWDTLLAFPTLFLAIGIITIVGPGQNNASFAVAVVNMPVFARLMRAITLSIKSQEFVEAARAIGCSQWRVMFRSILPNCIGPLMVQFAISAQEAILIEAGLSYLGLGSQPPAPSWGNMLQASQGFLNQSPTYGLFPGLAISMVVVGLNYLADGLQDAIDPRRTLAGNKN